jgi:hypothetical protein
MSDEYESVDEVDEVEEESGSEEEEVAAPVKAKRKGKKWKVRYIKRFQRMPVQQYCCS